MHIKRDSSNWNIKIILSVLIGTGNPEWVGLFSAQSFSAQLCFRPTLFGPPFSAHFLLYKLHACITWIPECLLF